jgi:hypothetical protein
VFYPLWMVVGVERGYRFRFYPTAEQAGLLTRTFGCVRLVYNLGLQAPSGGVAAAAGDARLPGDVGVADRLEEDG